jgi:transcription elongation factor Elf1
MEIIKQGNPRIIKYRMRCPSCGCVMVYQEEEVQRDRDGRYIICPTCGDYIDQSLAKKQQKMTNVDRPRRYKGSKTI